MNWGMVRWLCTWDSYTKIGGNGGSWSANCSAMMSYSCYHSYFWKPLFLVLPPPPSTGSTWGYCFGCSWQLHCWFWALSAVLSTHLPFLILFCRRKFKELINFCSLPSLFCLFHETEGYKGMCVCDVYEGRTNFFSIFFLEYALENWTISIEMIRYWIRHCSKPYSLQLFWHVSFRELDVFRIVMLICECQKNQKTLGIETKHC